MMFDHSDKHKVHYHDEHIRTVMSEHRAEPVEAGVYSADDDVDAKKSVEAPPMSLLQHSLPNSLSHG